MINLRSGYNGYRRGDHDDFSAVGAYVEALEAQVERLTTALRAIAALDYDRAAINGAAYIAHAALEV
jgi:hypothetical protein